MGYVLTINGEISILDARNMVLSSTRPNAARTLRYYKEIFSKHKRFVNLKNRDVRMKNWVLQSN